MKALHSALAVLLALAATASADWVIESKIESPKLNATTTTKFKGDKMRSDIKGGPAGEMSTIMDATSGDTVTLIHAQKIAMKTSGAQLKSAMEAARKMLGTPDGASAAVTPTGKSEKIGQYDCDIYTWTDGKTTTTLWIAKNYPQAESLKAFQKLMQKSILGGGQLGPDTSALPGFAVKTETLTNGDKITTTVLSTKEATIDASEFQAPAGYQTMALPSGLGGK
jgi:hypothetical protein